jgi:hypothetical protein
MKACHDTQQNDTYHGIILCLKLLCRWLHFIIVILSISMLLVIMLIVIFKLARVPNGTILHVIMLIVIILRNNAECQYS